QRTNRIDHLCNRRVGRLQREQAGHDVPVRGDTLERLGREFGPGAEQVAGARALQSGLRMRAWRRAGDLRLVGSRNERSIVDTAHVARPYTDRAALWGKRVPPPRGPRRLDYVVVAHPRGDVAVNIGRVHHDVHVFLNRHRLVVAHQRPFDQIVALAVAVEPRLLRPAVLLHEGVVFVPDHLAGGAGLEQVESEAARLEREGEFVLHLRRHLADHAGAAKLGVIAAGPAVLDQQHHVIPLADDPILKVPLRDLAGRTDRRRSAEINAVLAAVPAAIGFGDAGDVGFPHARLDRGEGGAHGAVLHARRALDQLDFLRALDHLDAVD